MTEKTMTKLKHNQCSTMGTVFNMISVRYKKVKVLLYFNLHA